MTSSRNVGADLQVRPAHTISAMDVKRVIVACLGPQLVALGHDPELVPDTFDLRAEGVVDSLRFVQLLADLEERLGIDVDVADLEPHELTVVGRLAAHISAPHAGSTNR